MNIKKHKLNSKKIYIIIPSIPVLLLGVYVAAVYYSSGSLPFTKEPSISGSEQTDGSHNNPQAKDRGSKDFETNHLPVKNPDTIDREDNKGVSNSQELKPASVGIANTYTSDTHLEIRAFTPSVIEGGGTCTATLTSPDNITVAESSEAFIDATTSQCRPIEVPLSKLTTSSKWSLSVNYRSKTHIGSSPEKVVEL